MGMFAVLSWLIVGFIVGLLARWFTGGSGPRGFLMTALTGVAGSVAGGALAKPFGLPTSGAGGFLMAVIGAVALITGVGALMRMTQRR
jgi:uncharacterized membrane protein YeaQ/YmgE (transglycosylase-associated protein family)